LSKLISIDPYKFGWSAMGFYRRFRNP
jgi:hypothetical protein